jgi:hypothetical protein
LNDGTCQVVCFISYVLVFQNFLVETYILTYIKHRDVFLIVSKHAAHVPITILLFNPRKLLCGPNFYIYNCVCIPFQHMSSSLIRVFIFLSPPSNPIEWWHNLLHDVDFSCFDLQNHSLVGI